MDKTYTLKKEERLSGKKAIDHLFAQGHSLLVYPYRIFYIQAEKSKEAVSILISVPKRRLKHAVDRNRVKRCCREAFRLNKSILTEPLQNLPYSLQAAFVYIGDKVEEYSLFESRMIKALNQLKEKME